MPRILLIDDDQHLAAPLASYYARFDCALDAATRPSEGLAKLRAGHYDAAILDVSKSFGRWLPSIPMARAPCSIWPPICLRSRSTAPACACWYATCWTTR